jgi:hypothetical protein
MWGQMPLLWHALSMRPLATLLALFALRRWRMPVELAVTLSALALYDVVIYADDSGSMRSGDGERIEDLKLIVSKVAEVATLFDDDGIEVCSSLAACGVSGGAGSTQVFNAQVVISHDLPVRIGLPSNTRCVLYP